MKLITDKTFRAASSITASSTKTGFPASNLALYDPDVLWIAAAFSANVTLVFDLGAAVPINQIWLNNANFLSVTLQANSANSWSSPAVSKSVTLADDDVGIIKGFFDLSETSYRYVRIVIPTQSLVSGTVPQLGNVTIGTAVNLPVSAWTPDVIHEFNSFVADNGSYTKSEKGKARHAFSAALTATTKAEIDALPLKGWLVGVIYTELGSVADSFMVYPPAGRRPRVRSQIDCDIEYVLEELA